MIRLLHSFSFRLLAVAFVGTHIPLICLLLWFVIGPGQAASPSQVLLITLVATLVATGITLFLVHRQVQPVLRASQIVAMTKPGTDVPDLPIASAYELSRLFGAVTDSFFKARQMMEERYYLIKTLSYHLEGPAVTWLASLQMLEKDFVLEPELRAQILDDLRDSAHHQVELLKKMRSVLNGTATESMKD